MKLIVGAGARPNFTTIQQAIPNKFREVALERSNMTWILSRFRTVIMLRSAARRKSWPPWMRTAACEGMPFMPEMLQFCGKTFSCQCGRAQDMRDGAQDVQGRRLNATVHLAGLRCDGSAHGGCEADCNLFWKDVWLKPAGERLGSSGAPAPDGAKRPVPLVARKALWPPRAGPRAVTERKRTTPARRPGSTTRPSPSPRGVSGSMCMTW